MEQINDLYKLLRLSNHPLENIFLPVPSNKVIMDSFVPWSGVMLQTLKQKDIVLFKQNKV